jgi:hypothetical protein
VSGPAGVRDIVRRATASALANIGAFDVSASGEPAFAGDGSSQDAEWMKTLADCAADGVQVVVECD